MVLDFSELKTWYAEGRFTPYFETDPEALYGVIEHFLASVKPYQRVERVVRDVPASRDAGKPNYVVAGINVTNAQQLVERVAETGRAQPLAPPAPSRPLPGRCPRRICARCSLPSSALPPTAVLQRLSGAARVAAVLFRAAGGG